MPLFKKRTATIFSGCQHLREVFQDRIGNKITVDTVQNPNSNEYIQFVNTSLAMSVFSSKVNLVFSTPLVPSAIGYVDDDYWRRLLKKNSLQEIYEYDAAATAKEIRELLSKGFKRWFDEDDEEAEEKIKELVLYFERLLQYVEEEDKFLFHSSKYQPRPDIVDYDDIPLNYKVKEDILVIFDAFEFICQQLKYERESSTS